MGGVITNTNGERVYFLNQIQIHWMDKLIMFGVSEVFCAKHDGLIAKFGCLLETKAWNTFTIGSDLKKNKNEEIGTLDQLYLYRWEPNGAKQQKTNGLNVKTANHKRTKSASPMSPINTIGTENITQMKAIKVQQDENEENKKNHKRPKQIKTKTVKKRSNAKKGSTPHKRTKSAMPSSFTPKSKKKSIASPKKRRKIQRKCYWSFHRQNQRKKVWIK